MSEKNNVNPREDFEKDFNEEIEKKIMFTVQIKSP